MTSFAELFQDLSLTIDLQSTSYRDKINQITANIAQILESARTRIGDNYDYLEGSKFVESVLIFNNACWLIGEIG